LALALSSQFSGATYEGITREERGEDEAELGLLKARLEGRELARGVLKLNSVLGVVDVLKVSSSSG
jgi:hypothetical protein